MTVRRKGLCVILKKESRVFMYHISLLAAFFTLDKSYADTTEFSFCESVLLSCAIV